MTNYAKDPIFKDVFGDPKRPWLPAVTFAVEREKIRIAKEDKNKPAPWTKSLVLRDFRFTNYKRGDDKVTRWIVENLLEPEQDDPNVWFYSVISRIFNRIDTLKVLKDEGCMSLKKWNPSKMKKILRKLKDSGESLFGNAYLVSAPGSGKGNKADFLIDNLFSAAWDNRKDISRTIRDCNSMQATTEALQNLPGLGPFLAYEVCLDLVEIPLLSKAADRNTWTSLGPGSRRGLNIAYGKEISKRDQLEAIVKLFQGFKKNLPSWMPKPYLEDLENCLCESSKIYRIMNGGHAKNKYPGSGKHQLELDV